jgi:AmiR/NasT family two-component response regulator
VRRCATSIDSPISFSVNWIYGVAVMLFSGSDDQSDIVTAYCNFASGYIVKPVDAPGLNEIVGLAGRLCTHVLAFPQHRSIRRALRGTPADAMQPR